MVSRVVAESANQDREAHLQKMSERARISALAVKALTVQNVKSGEAIQVCRI
jgi:hypothetical protein